MDRITLLKKLIALYQELLSRLQNKPAPATPTPIPMETTNGQKLVAAAKASLGKSFWIGTGVDRSVACALSVNAVHTLAFGFPIGGGNSTHDMYLALLASPYFKLTTVYAPGCIIISPTGWGNNPNAFPNGHVGIVCNHGICANNSATGKWSENYATYTDWENQFTKLEDYPIFLFERI